VGTKDLLVRPSNSFAMQSEIGCPMHVYEDMGHGVIGQVPVFFNQRLLHHWAASTLSLPRSNVMETFYRQSALAEEAASVAASASAQSADEGIVPARQSSEAAPRKAGNAMRRSVSMAVTRADWQLHGEEPVESERKVSFRPLPYYSEWPPEKKVIRIPLDVSFPLSPKSQNAHKIWKRARSNRNLLRKLLVLFIVAALVLLRVRRVGLGGFHKR
jgi:hypothetical protein